MAEAEEKLLALKKAYFEAFSSEAGKQVMSDLEKVGAESFWCDARKTAVGFYKKFGMERLGTEFNKSGFCISKWK